MHRWSLALVLPALAVVPVSVVSASSDGPTLFGHPVNVPPEPSPEELARRKAAFEQYLEDENLVFTGDRIMPRDQAEGIDPGPQAGFVPREPHYATIFLNFFGGPLTNGTNAAEGESGCVNGSVDYPGYIGTEGDALAIIQVFENAMEPYAVRVAYEEAPPQHLPYSMVMMGGTPQDVGIGGGALGVSCSSDCGDVWWRDTTLAFTEVSNNPTTLGNTALQEAAHAFGLDHIDGSQHIMYPVATSGSKVWASGCTPYNDSTGPIGCTYVHEEFCPEGQQNDDAELMAFFGPDAPDVEAPVVTITSPADGTTLEQGGSADIAVEVTDDHEGFGWRLRIVPPEGDPTVINAYQFETSWGINFTGQPTGTYEIWIEAIDHDGNEGSDMVTLHHGVEGPGPGEDESGDGGSGDGGPGDDGTGDGADDGADDGGDDADGTADDGGTGDTAPADGGDDGGGGCACVTSGSRSWGGLGLLFVLGAVGRRRRRA